MCNNVLNIEHYEILMEGPDTYSSCVKAKTLSSHDFSILTIDHLLK